jgi:hypothetical protein
MLAALIPSLRVATSVPDKTDRPPIKAAASELTELVNWQKKDFLVVAQDLGLEVMVVAVCGHYI